MIESAALDGKIGATFRVSGKVGIAVDLSGKVSIGDAQAKPLSEITEPVNYNTYATDYFAQIYTKD